MSEPEYLYKCPNHGFNLNNMRLNNKWCDLTIKVKKREYRAHKFILAANLKYFDTMLSRDFFEESKEGVVTMECVEEADMEAFLSFAYTGEMLLTDSNVLELLEVANYFGEDGIRDACIDFLKANLKVHQACLAYKFADSIDCLSLKILAKATILSNFGYCSQSSDFLNFQFKHLMDIFSDETIQSIDKQRKFFEGIIKWTMHSVEKRGNLMIDLLNSIEVGKLKFEDLMGYLLKNEVDTNDEHGIMRRVMVCYHKKKIQEKPVTAEQALMITGCNYDNKTFEFQFCKLSEKTWTSLEDIPVHSDGLYLESIILNDKLYYIDVEHSRNEESDVNVFNPVTRRIKKLHSSNSILKGSALCSCSRFLYLCGGMHKDGSKSEQVLKYNVQSNSFETLPPMRHKRKHAAAIIYQDCLVILGGCDERSKLNSVKKYDPDTKNWTTFPSMCEARNLHAVAVLNGKLYACGGGYTRSVEAYDPSTDSWQQVADMNQERRDFVVIAHDGKLYAVGGNRQKSVEVYDPVTNEWQIDDELSSGLQIEHPRGGLVSASCVFDMD